MNVTDWRAMARDFAKRMYTRAELETEWDSMVASYTREVPDGLATRLGADVRERHKTEPCSECPDEDSGRACQLKRDATPEACAALDAAVVRVAQLQFANDTLGELFAERTQALMVEVAHYRAAAEAAEKRALTLEAELRSESDRGDAFARRLQQEHAISMQRDGMLTQALHLLDDARAALLGDKEPGDVVDRIMALTTAPTSVPAPPSAPCELLPFFTGGELTSDQAEAFRKHLPGCAECRGNFKDALHLDALAAQIKETTRG